MTFDFGGEFVWRRSVLVTLHLDSNLIGRWAILVALLLCRELVRWRAVLVTLRIHFAALSEIDRSISRSRDGIDSKTKETEKCEVELHFD